MSLNSRFSKKEIQESTKIRIKNPKTKEKSKENSKQRTSKSTTKKGKGSQRRRVKGWDNHKTAAQLDAEIEAYSMKDKEYATAKLDAEMDAYNSQRKNLESDPPKI